MGMDVFGKNPKAEAGKYFRNSIWYWRPLADLCLHLAPEVCAKCEHWHSNDRDGLDEEGAEALVAVLAQRMRDGTIERYVTTRAEMMEALPDEPCDLCGGAGVRKDDIARKAGFVEQLITEEGHPRFGQRGWCNGCEGKGVVRPSITRYHCTTENVAEFIAFLRASGGFEIH